VIFFVCKFENKLKFWVKGGKEEKMDTKLYTPAPERDFILFNPQTQYLILALTERFEELERIGGLSTAEVFHLNCLAENLSQSPSIIEAAEYLYHNQPLKWSWRDFLPVILADCLYPYHADSYLHSVRMAEIVQFLREEYKRCGFANFPDFGNKDFAVLTQNLIMTEDDWAYLLAAAYHHDGGKMCLPKGFWNKPGKFTPEEKECRKSHPGMFFPIGEMFAVPLKVTALAVAHHYLNLGYPDNGLIKCFQDIIFEPKFKVILIMLITLDCYDGMRGPREYRLELYSHKQVMEKLPNELGQMGTDMVPIVELVNSNSIGSQLYPH
jgi:hypothetical protein